MESIHSTFAQAGLVRPQEGRVLAGVIAGLGRRVGLDPWPARLLFGGPAPSGDRREGNSIRRLARVQGRSAATVGQQGKAGRPSWPGCRRTQVNPRSETPQWNL